MNGCVCKSMFVERSYTLMDMWVIQCMHRLSEKNDKNKE